MRDPVRSTRPKPRPRPTPRTLTLDELKGLNAVNTGSIAQGRAIAQPAIDLAREAGTSIRNASSYLRNNVPRPNAPLSLPNQPRSSSGGGRGRSYGRGGGRGGGGGGGGVDPAAEEKAIGLRQMAGLLQLLQGIQNPTEDPNRKRLSDALAADQATATGSFDALDKWLAANQSNAYANAPRATYQAPNAGVAALLADQGGNPNSINAEAAVSAQRGQQTADTFNNLLNVLAAAQTASQQSRGAESQMARNYSTNELAAGDNAMRAFLDQRESKAREAANQQRLQMAAEILKIAAQFGFDMPSNEQMGIR